MHSTLAKAWWRGPEPPGQPRLLRRAAVDRVVELAVVREQHPVGRPRSAADLPG